MAINLKNWKKIGAGIYSLSKQENRIGSLTIKSNVFERKATFEIENQVYHIKHIGFWKNNIEIVDAQGYVVLKTETEKWYSNATIIEFEGKKLKLIIRNNPLVEYAILDGETEILSYGLDVNDGKAVTRIQTDIQNQSYLLDFYLWYLFVPVAQENMGDDFTFLLLSTA
jgi:hypothetical protein